MGQQRAQDDMRKRPCTKFEISKKRQKMKTNGATGVVAGLLIVVLSSEEKMGEVGTQKGHARVGERGR
jgi:hypothetical protein